MAFYKHNNRRRKYKQILRLSENHRFSLNWNFSHMPTLTRHNLHPWTPKHETKPTCGRGVHPLLPQQRINLLGSSHHMEPSCKHGTKLKSIIPRIVPKWKLTSPMDSWDDSTPKIYIIHRHLHKIIRHKLEKKIYMESHRVNSASSRVLPLVHHLYMLLHMSTTPMVHMRGKPHAHVP